MGIPLFLRQTAPGSEALVSISDPFIFPEKNHTESSVKHSWSSFPLSQESCREPVLKVTVGGHIHACLRSHRQSLPWTGKKAPTPLQHFKGLDGSNFCFVEDYLPLKANLVMVQCFITRSPRKHLFYRERI